MYCFRVKSNVSAILTDCAWCFAVLCCITGGQGEKRSEKKKRKKRRKSSDEEKNFLLLASLFPLAPCDTAKHCETVSIIKEAKYLGVMVDQYLNWKEQITAIKKKVSRGIGMLKYSKRYLPLLTIQSMYKSLVEPYFRYCCPVWGSCGSTAINELQKLQNRAARIVTNSRYDASAKPIIKKLGWHTVSEIIQMETLSMVYKSINDLAPTYLTEMFSRLSDTCKRELRNTRSDLEIPMRKSANGQKCFSYKGATMWNRLSLESKLSPTLKTFKKSIANHAFS